MRTRDDSRWTVAKFGGTSVANAARWESIASIVCRHRSARRRVLVVCSALSGVTDRLVALDQALEAGVDVSPMVRELERVHLALAAALLIDGSQVLGAELASLAEAVQVRRGDRSVAARATLLAHGELLSSRLGVAYLARRFSAELIDARTLLVAEAAPAGPARHLAARCPDEPVVDVRARLAATGADVVVTQGFIARAAEGGTALLGRGGSDTSAAYLAAALDAHALEIWSDVPGLFTADPRHVSDARLLRSLDYAEAHALASLGARALHPRALEPCRKRGIVLRLGWTERPEIEGTRIGAMRGPAGARGITARGGLALIEITRRATLEPAGFRDAVVGCANRHGLAAEFVAMSRSELRFTVDLAAAPTTSDGLEVLVSELGRLGSTTRWSPVGCVSAVGVREAPEAFRRTAGQLFVHAADPSHVSVVVERGLVRDLTHEAHRELFGAVELDGTVFGPRWDQLNAVPDAIGQEPRRSIGA